jgi:hypothetical protein
MEEKSKIEKMVTDIKDYAETRLDIAVLNAQDKVSHVISSFATVLIVGALAGMTLLFASVAGAWYLGEYLQRPSIGFLCVAGFYLLLGLVLFLMREKWIQLPIINAILKKITFHEND